MNREGPQIETLLRRLAETPADFLLEPQVGQAGMLPVAALVSDLLRDLGGLPLTPEQASTFQATDTRQHANRLKIIQVACWLLHDAWVREQAVFEKPRELPELALLFLTLSASELAAVTPAARFVSDPDRREELARLCLKDLGLRPAGETATQAQDRLNTLSSVERQRVIRAARVAEERARAIREEMARKAKAEADAKAMRE